MYAWGIEGERVAKRSAPHPPPAPGGKALCRGSEWGEPHTPPVPACEVCRGSEQGEPATGAKQFVGGARSSGSTNPPPTPCTRQIRISPIAITSFSDLLSAVANGTIDTVPVPYYRTPDRSALVDMPILIWDEGAAIAFKTRVTPLNHNPILTEVSFLIATLIIQFLTSRRMTSSAHCSQLAAIASLTIPAVNAHQLLSLIQKEGYTHLTVKDFKYIQVLNEWLGQIREGFTAPVTYTDFEAFAGPQKYQSIIDDPKKYIVLSEYMMQA